MGGGGLSASNGEVRLWRCDASPVCAIRVTGGVLSKRRRHVRKGVWDPRTLGPSGPTCL